MVLSRDEGTPPRHAGSTPTSVPDIARALRAARQGEGFDVPAAAERAGLSADDVEALESGIVGRLHDRVETLRSLRRYADSLGLPGSDYVMTTIARWPAPLGALARNGDTGALPVVSVSTAPAGGHSPAEVWPGERTGVTDFTITGMVGPAVPVQVTENDTGQVPVFDTGEIPAVRSGAPTILKVLVAVVALLVVLGGVGLAEHSHVAGWAKDVRADTSRWYTDATRAVGLTHKPAAKPPAAVAGHPVLPKVDIVQNTGANGVTFNVHATSFNVKVAAYVHPCWIQVTDVGHFAPVYSGVLAGGQTNTYTVTQSTTVETASGSGRVFVYWHGKFIGFYFPTKVPYTMTFNAVG
ncbi:MAG TPA: helix-turn-helix domain-containing protein [Acidimicrobiales bacterium]|jgi:hypothetical protein